MPKINAVPVKCPAKGCLAEAKAYDFATLPSYSYGGFEDLLHAKVTCAKGHNFNMPFESVEVLLDEKELVKIQYDV